MRKFWSYMFFGALSRDWAGSRPLTDKERRGLILMIYAMVINILWYQWRADAIAEEYQQDIDKLLDKNEEHYNDYKELRLQRDQLKQELWALRPLNETQKGVIARYDAAELPYDFKTIATFYETEMSEGERAAFGFDKYRFRNALSGVRLDA